MKALYDKDGVTPLEEVELMAWDWEKYVTFKGKGGVFYSDKLWKFDVKCSNALYHLPLGYLDEFTKLSRKDVATRLKANRKSSTEYTVKLENGNIRSFKSLRKALNFCKATPSAVDLCGSHKEKSWSCFCGLLVKEEGSWYYIARQEFVSETTLSKFCNQA